MLILDQYNTIVARYTYDIWGNCKVYDGNNKEQTSEYNIGVINPFRWKGFYYDAESGFYYANGSYYDPYTGRYLDAAPVSAVFDNAFSPRRIDRTGLMCDNVLELAGNPFTSNTTVELATNPNYDATTPKNWFQQAIESVANWYRGLSNGGQVAVGSVLFALSMVLAVFTGGASEAIQVLVEVAIGVGVGIGIWALSALATGERLTWDGFAQAAIDSFVVSSLFAFVEQSVNAIKCVARSTNSVEVVANPSPESLKGYELDPRSIELAKEGNPSFRTFRKRVWQNEAKFRPDFYGSDNIRLMSSGCAPLDNLGRPIHLHHVVGKSVDRYYVIKVTASQHTAIHKAIGYYVSRSKLAWTRENAIKYGGLI